MTLSLAGSAGMSVARSVGSAANRASVWRASVRSASPSSLYFLSGVSMSVRSLAKSNCSQSTSTWLKSPVSLRVRVLSRSARVLPAATDRPVASSCCLSVATSEPGAP